METRPAAATLSGLGLPALGAGGTDARRLQAVFRCHRAAPGRRARNHRPAAAARGIGARPNGGGREASDRHLRSATVGTHMSLSIRIQLCPSQQKRPGRFPQPVTTQPQDSTAQQPVRPPLELGRWSTCGVRGSLLPAPA
eukprot:4408166-Prymnesium_polylepis.1